MVIYLLTTELSKLYLFKKLSIFFDLDSFFFFISECRKYFKFLGLDLIRNYLIDAIWFVSFFLIFNHFWSWEKSFIKNTIIISLPLITEILQFLFPNLGTFDLFDLLLYISLFVLCYLIFYEKQT